MACIVLGAVISRAVKEHFDVFVQVSDATVTVLIEWAKLPMDEDVAAVVVPVGVLMGVWIFLWELRQV